MKQTDIRIVEARFETEPLKFRAPLKFGGRLVTESLLLNAFVTVETRTGLRGRGFGSMPVGNVWGWPSKTVTTDQSSAAMVEFSRRAVEAAGAHRDFGHPLDITCDLAEGHAEIDAAIVCEQKLSEPMPRLAQLVSASPVEAAIHDAYGRALNESAYNLLGPEFANHDLAHYIDGRFAGEYLDRYTLRQPKPRMPLYHLVGAADTLTTSDIVKPIGDELPETLADWIVYNGLTHLKIKLTGDDLKWDVDRVLTVEQISAETQAARDCTKWFYSADFNEKCENVDYVLDFLAKIRERSPAAFERLQYIEQPTHRDLHLHRENRMHAAAKIKPVVIDESLVSFESLLLSQELGYSGVALKACKGHTEALLMGAAAQKFGLFLCVQDLTCPGASFLHSATLSARIPTVAAIEGNGRQYCPDANRGWSERFPTMFHVTDGTLGTSALNGPGLGF